MAECVDIHIVTAGYLRRFTDSRGLIQPVKRGVRPKRLVNPRRPETVGYRRYFFVDREIARAAERRFSQYENRGLQVAIHMVRNPAFQLHIAGLKNQNVEETIQEHDFGVDGESRFLRHITSEQFSVDHMLGMVPKLASLIASAHWTMIEFPASLLATSDQPVSMVPLLPEGMQAPVQAQLAGGYLLSEEFRFPIDPRHALLFTWANECDTAEPLVGSDDLAANLNRAVIAGADRDWFHNPNRRPTCLPRTGVRTDECYPVARALLPEYGPVAAVESQRRLDASACLNTMIENEVTDRFHVARVAA